MPVPSNYRWLFQDPQATLADYRVPINPNRMSSPYLGKQLDTLPNLRGRLRTRQSPPVPFEWTFSGVIRTQAHHDSLLAYSQADNNIHITDHLGRQWDVIPQRFNPTEKRPSVRIADKYDYEFVSLVIGRLA